jgi:branched-chain amino acid transport system permease protein
MGALRSFVGPGWTTLFFGTLVALPFAITSVDTAHWVLNMLIFTLMYAAMSSAWNLVGGMAGYPSLGHAAFFGLGAYFEAIWFQHHAITSGYEPFILLPLVGLVGAAVGYPFAWISMRTRSDVFAIVTITLLFVGQQLAYNLHGLTNGSSGMAMPVLPFPADTFERPFYLAFVGLLALAMAITWGAMRSKVGLSLVAVRADEDKAAGIGVHVNGVKMLSFCVSVGLTAMAGGIYASYEFYLYPQYAFDPLITIGVVLMTFLGGRGTLWGPVLGAFILEMSHLYLASSTLGQHRLFLVVWALIFLVVMLFMPRGILPSLQERLRFRRARTAPPSDPPSGDPLEPSRQTAPTTPAEVNGA